MKIKSILAPPNINMTDFDTVNPLSIMGLVVTGNRIVNDRYGILNKYSSLDLFEFPKPPKNIMLNKSLSDIIDGRADEIISFNKDIYVACSGGVDSTAMLVSFLKHSEIKDRLYIVTNKTKYNGIEKENPLLYNYLLDNKYNILYTENSNLPKEMLCNDDFVFVSGDCCDQLIGSFVNYFYPEYYEKDWKDSLLDFMGKNYPNYIVNHVYDFIDVYSEYIKNSADLDIKNFGEFTWFMNFALKFEPIKYEIPLLFNSQLLLDRLVNFYETDNFQLYALNNYKQNIGDKNIFIEKYYNLYKADFKEYIYEYFRDDYIISKGKYPSELYRLEDYDSIVVIDENNKIYKMNAKCFLKIRKMKINMLGLHGAISF